MTLESYDYQNAITRIWNTSRTKVKGTGFLITPSYVLTCAHVVLDALGIQKAEYASYDKRPPERIQLDFSVAAPGTYIEAEVVAWKAYQSNDGDIAGLRLLSPIPNDQIQPLPIRKSDRLTKDECYLIHGFAKDEGSNLNYKCGGPV